MRSSSWIRIRARIKSEGVDVRLSDSSMGVFNADRLPLCAILISGMGITVEVLENRNWMSAVWKKCVHDILFLKNSAEI